MTTQALCSRPLFRASYMKRRFDPGSCAAEPHAAKRAVVAVGPVVTEYEVELIVMKRESPALAGRSPAAADVDDDRIEYLVKWLNFPSSQNTWEPLSNLVSKGAKKLVSAWNAKERTRVAATAPAAARQRS